MHPGPFGFPRWSGCGSSRVNGDGHKQDDRGPDDRDALVPEPADEAEHDPGLGDAQGEGWPQTAGQ